MQDLLKVILFTIVFLNLWIPNSFADGRARLFTSDAVTTNSMSTITSKDDDQKNDRQGPTHHPPHPIVSTAVPISAPTKDHPSLDQPAKKHDQPKDREKERSHKDRDQTIIYYSDDTPSYNVVSYAPYIGQILPMLPWDAETTVINGQTYYTSNGVYYIDNPQGYQVVDQPIAVDTIVTGENTDDSFTVNIPDNNGGYVAIAIKKSETGSGYVGPQGEYYEDFPTVEQLQETYL